MSKKKRTASALATALGIPPTKPPTTLDTIKELNVHHRKKAEFRSLMRQEDSRGLIQYFSTYYAISPELLAIPSNLLNCVLEEFKDLNF